MAGRVRSRSRSPMRSKSGVLDGERRSAPFKNRIGKLNHSSDKMVYLSNLPFELTWIELKDFVREKAGEVNFVETLENREGKSKGCAVVEFKNRESAIKCVQTLHRTELRGRLIVVKEIRDPVSFFHKVREDTGVDFLGSRDRGAGDCHAASSAAENETFGLSPAFLDQLKIKLPLVNRIFITNISQSCSFGRLYEVCSLAGKITWIDLQMDKEGKSKGMAVCQFSHPIEAVQAVSMLHDQRLFDRTLIVKMDRFDKDPKADRREGGLPLGLRSVGMGLGAGGAPVTDVASVLSSIFAPARHISGPGAVLSTPNPFGANPFAPSLIPQMQLQPAQLQQPQPPTYEHSTAFHHTSGVYGSTMRNQTQPHPSQTYYTAQAQPTNPPNYYSNGSVLKPEYGSGPRDGGYGPDQFFSQHPNSSSVLSSGGGYAGGHAYKNQTVSRALLIKNLPLDYTWSIVSDRVQQYGDLESVEMLLQGIAKIRFVQMADAERCKANLHETKVEGRVIAIEYL